MSEACHGVLLLFWTRNTKDRVLVCSSVSLVCSLLLGGLQRLATVKKRRPQEWIARQMTLCDFLTSACFLILCGAGVDVLQPLLVCSVVTEVAANAWRLLMYFHVLCIYRDPFKPDRHTWFYPIFVFLCAAATASSCKGILAMGVDDDENNVQSHCVAAYIAFASWGLFYVPFLLFVVGGLGLQCVVFIFLVYERRIERRHRNTNNHSVTVEKHLVRQRVLWTGGLYLLVHGAQLSVGVMLASLLQWDSAFALGPPAKEGAWTMLTVVVILTCLRPVILLVGWLLVHQRAVGPRHAPRLPRLQTLRSVFSSAGRSELGLAVLPRDGTGGPAESSPPRRGIQRSNSEDDPLRRFSNALGGIEETGFKEELRFELIFDVVRCIAQEARREVEAVGEAPITWQSTLDAHGDPVPTRHYRARSFCNVRAAFGITPEMYASVFNDDLKEDNEWRGRLRETVSEGASGSFFYRVLNGQVPLIVKQVTRDEQQNLLRLLPAYERHVAQHGGRSLVQYLDCYSISLRWKCSSKIYFVVMRNFVPTKPWLTFDLKGATANRRALSGAGLPPSPLPFVSSASSTELSYGTLRDWEWMDVAMGVDVSEPDKAALADMINADAEFLAGQGLLDYSLLIGIVRVETALGWPLEALQKAGGYVSLDRQKVYFFGIIDVLEYYSLRWRLQHCALTMGYSVMCRSPAADGISAMSPRDYADRFRTFVAQEVLQLRGSIPPILAEQRCCFKSCARQRPLDSRERWAQLWQRCRRGLVRERIRAEREDAVRRIGQLEEQLARNSVVARASGSGGLQESPFSEEGAPTQSDTSASSRS